MWCRHRQLSKVAILKCPSGKKWSRHRQGAAPQATMLSTLRPIARTKIFPTSTLFAMSATITGRSRGRTAKRSLQPKLRQPDGDGSLARQGFQMFSEKLITSLLEYWTPHCGQWVYQVFEPKTIDLWNIIVVFCQTLAHSNSPLNKNRIFNQFATIRKHQHTNTENHPRFSRYKIKKEILKPSETDVCFTEGAWKSKASFWAELRLSKAGQEKTKRSAEGKKSQSRSRCFRK